jgi:hypothetical protein
MLTAVTLKEIERIFDILAEFGLSREAVVIPLKPVHPGGVRLRPDNRLEITLDSAVPLEESLAVIRERVREIVESGAGAGLKRAED